jgi:acetyl-CoA carboxylase carboxyl transferase subunit beta
MAWFRKQKKPLKASDRRDLPPDVFQKCDGCGEILYREKLAQNLNVCPNCSFHFRISADEYVQLLTDPGTFQELDAELQSGDPLGFVDSKPYPQRLAAAEAKVGRKEALISGIGKIDGMPLSLAVMDFRFIGGSMGSVVGEKIARSGRRALEQRIPLAVVSATGGARMQEGIYSLMQMAKTSGHAMLGDVNLAEPSALIGFTGPRVIKETIRQELPDGFQRSEYLLDHGMVDRVVDRREMKATVSLLLRHMWAGWPDEG